MQRMLRKSALICLMLAVCLALTAFAGAAETKVQNLDYMHVQITLPSDARSLRMGPPDLDYWMVNYYLSGAYSCSICAAEKYDFPLTFLNSSTSKVTFRGLEYTLYTWNTSGMNRTDTKYYGMEDMSKEDQDRIKEQMRQTIYSLDYVVERQGWKYDFSFQKTGEKFTDEERAEIAAIMETVRYTDGVSQFQDLEGHWSEQEVLRSVELGLFSGSGDGCFHPDDAMSRAMLVKVLFNLEGGVLLPASGRFSDVPEDAWYAEAANQMSHLGVVEGSGGAFYPDETVTREQLAVMLYRYERLRNEPEATGELTAFADRDQVSAWAVEAMAWAVDQGLITGVKADTLAPQAPVTRAQAAAILVRYLDH